MKIVKPEVIFRWVSPDPERSIEDAARLCSDLRCGCCGSPDLIAKESTGIIIECSTCHRQVAAQYDCHRCSFMYVYQRVCTLFMSSRKKIRPHEWPKYLVSFNPGNKESLE